MAFENNYLDMWNIFANELVGDPVLFLIIGCFLTVFVSLKFRAPDQVPILLCMIWGSIYYAKTGQGVVWAFILLAAGALFYIKVSDTLQKR